jgi:transcriptional regulator with XRE-family HTH domain
MLGNIIKQRRLELGMTQEELAHKLGYKSKSTINKIETGINCISQSKIVAFAKALDCSPYLFIEDTQHDPRPDDAVMRYAEKLAQLSPEQQDNVMKYIDFLSSDRS